MDRRINYVKRVCVARSCRSIFTAKMWQQRIQNYQSPFLYFQCQQFIFRPGRIVEDFEARSSAVGTHEAGFQSEVVAARNDPETAVLDCRIFQREPKAEHSQRLGVKKSRVLMTRHLAA